MDEHEINIRMPLFDRLVDDEPRDDWESRPLRTLDRAGLKQSVRRELELLFNTRSPTPPHHTPGESRSVIDYGIPDLGAFSAQNQDHRAELAEILRNAALSFEPRLHQIRIQLVADPARNLSLGAQLDAVVLIDGVPEPVSFEVLVQEREGKVRVNVGA